LRLTDEAVTLLAREVLAALSRREEKRDEKEKPECKKKAI
jgi:hypothetical protein